ncbi:m-AAA protease-interacting protein 1, mitochondrial isoform X1 [Andrena cerasifolii]|uniref:m-AAA protease-interacting protein 1, mitochondrial isoform X1 n=1 Tax=Andrena cerasifolii TaxID=2819439 RepID=UPI0040376324
MLSLVFRTPSFRTQIRQFSTALICSRNQVKRKATHYWTELKCSNFINPNVAVYRSYNSTANDNILLRPLMDLPLNTQASVFAWLKLLCVSFIIRFKIDREFNLDDYMTGSRHAIIVISRALAARNYESLDGLVKENTLDILKENVDCLPHSERELIAINEHCMLLNVPTEVEINVDRTEDTEEQTVEISQLVFYVREPDKSESNMEQEIGSIDHFITQFQRAKCIACNYTFQRTYTNGIGGSWVATVVNHFSPNVESSKGS